MKQTFVLSLAVAAALTLAPALSSMVLGSTTAFGPLKSARELATSQKEKARLRGSFVNYERALAIYRDLLAQGIDPGALVTPNPNEPSTILPYLRGKWEVQRTEILDESATEKASENTVTLQVEDLKDHQKTRLNRFVRIGQCPESLQEYIPGFYDLCKSLIRKNERRTRRPGILQSIIKGTYDHSAAPQSQSYLLEMIREED